MFGKVFVGDAAGVVANDTLAGTFGDDTISGLGGNGTLSGASGNDVINGGEGADKLTSGFGADTLTGEADADSFHFNFATEGLDSITAFTSGTDKLSFSASGFGGGLLAGGTANLVTAADAASATSTSRYFILDNNGADAGTIYWDANGGSGADAIAFAKLQTGASLVASDLLLL